MTFTDEAQALLDQMARAYRAGDAAGCAALFAPDGELHSPYAPPARGRPEIEALHKIWTADGENKSFTLLNAAASGSLGWCLCRFAEGETAGTGTSLMVLERDVQGVWRIRICCLHGDTEDSTR
jgi:ketosteroid isomerase-like protein